MKKSISAAIAVLLVGFASTLSRAEEPEDACQADKVTVHLACVGTKIDPSTYPNREDFEFLIVICGDHVDKEYDIKIIQKEPTVVFKGNVKEESGKGFVMEFNTDRSYHFQLWIKKEKDLIVYPKSLDIPHQNLWIEKTTDNQLVFSNSEIEVPNTVYVRGYKPIKQCWGFMESDAVAVAPE